MLLSRSGCETTSQCAQVRYFSIIIFSSLVSQRQTTQQSRESDIVGDDGEATTTFVSKNCSTSGRCAYVVLFSFPLTLSLPSPSSALPPPPPSCLPTPSSSSFLPVLHPFFSPVSLSLLHFSPSSPAPLSLSSSPPDHLKC